MLWTFDNDVWKKFDKHINNSIPLYLLCHKFDKISDFFKFKSNRSWLLNWQNKLDLRQKNLKIQGYDTVKKMVMLRKK